MTSSRCSAATRRCCRGCSLGSPRGRRKSSGGDTGGLEPARGGAGGLEPAGGDAEVDESGVRAGGWERFGYELPGGSYCDDTLWYGVVSQLSRVGRADGAATLGALVRSRRLAGGLTQRELAVAARISVGALRDLEQGRTGRLQPGSLARLNNVLDADGRSGARLRSQVDGRSAGNLGGGGASACERAVRLGVLGPLEVFVGGARADLAAPKQRTVLGVLALNPNTPVHRETLIDAVWGQDPPAASVNLVQSYVGRLRRIMDAGRRPRDQAGLIVSAGTSYRLRATPAQLDLLAFEQLTAWARDRRAPGQEEASCAAYEAALELWRGDPLADVDSLRGHPAVIALRNIRTAAVMEYATFAASIARHERALPQLQELAEREPLNEKAHAFLMIALAAGGQQAAALGVYQDITGRLNDELGIRPGDELSAAQLLVLRQQLPVRRAAGPAGTPLMHGVIPRQLPRAVAHFAGRAEELAALGGLLTDTENRATSVVPLIVGAAGVGKTTLAVHWASRLAGRFPAGQIYVNLRGFDPSGTPVSPSTAIRMILDAFQIPAEQIPASPDAQIGFYRSLLADRRVLIVLDNARTEEQVRPLLPGSSAPLVVVTSRRRLTGLVITDNARTVELGVLDRGGARDLLACRAGAGRAAVEPLAVDELVELCSRLPLALAIAGARAAASPGRPLAGLAAELKDGRRHLDALDTADPATSIRAVFSWSYQSLSTPAAQMFRLLALHPGPDIATRAAASLAALGLTGARRALSELTDAHLVARSGAGRLGFHDLLRAYAAEQAAAVDSPAQRHAAAGRLLNYYAHAAHGAARLINPVREAPGLPVPPLPTGLAPDEPADDVRAMDWFEAEHQALVRMIALAAETGFHAQACLLAWSVADFFDRRGYFQDWISTQRIATSAAGRLGEPALQARACRTLGRACTELGEYHEAFNHLRTGLSLYARLGDRSGQAHSLLAVARVLEYLNRPGKALGCCAQAARLFEAVSDRGAQARALNGIGWFHAHLGAHRRAIAYCEQALSLHKSQKDRHGEASTWDSIGYAWHLHGDYRQAVTCYESALRLFEELGDRKFQAGTLRRMGDSQQLAGNTAAAAAAWRRAEAILSDLRRPDAARLRSTLNLKTLAATPAVPAVTQAQHDSRRPGHR